MIGPTRTHVLVALKQCPLALIAFGIWGCRAAAPGVGLPDAPSPRPSAAAPAAATAASANNTPALAAAEPAPDTAEVDAPPNGARGFERVAVDFTVSTDGPWARIGAAGGAAIVAPFDNKRALRVESGTATWMELPSPAHRLSAPVSVGGDESTLWIGSRFHVVSGPVGALQSRPFGSDHLYRNWKELLDAKPWSGGRLLGLWSASDRWQGGGVRGGDFEVLQGASTGVPVLAAPRCNDCDSVFPLAFDALPSGEVFLVGAREDRILFLKFRPSGGRGVAVPVEQAEAVVPLSGPVGAVDAVAADDVYFGAGHRSPTLHHYDGSTVSQLPLPAELITPNGRGPLPVMHITALPDGRLWVLFGTRHRNVNRYPLSRLFHRERRERDGSWSELLFPRDSQGLVLNPLGVAVTDQGHVYVLGHYGSQGAVFWKHDAD